MYVFRLTGLVYKKLRGNNDRLNYFSYDRVSRTSPVKVVYFSDLKLLMNRIDPSAFGVCCMLYVVFHLQAARFKLTSESQLILLNNSI